MNPVLTAYDRGMLPQTTIRCHVCHHHAPVINGRLGTHGRGRKGCSASGSSANRLPRFKFVTRIGTAATRKTTVTIEAEGITPALTYEFEGPGHRTRASEFADELSVPVYTGQALLERLQGLEDTFPGLRTIFQASLSFCVAILQMVPKDRT